jgi:DNA-binding PadR family transcriptional regulator
LGRLEELGLLTSHWEDGEAVEGRPRRRLYELTQQGAEVAERALAGKPEPGPSPRPVPRSA